MSAVVLTLYTTAVAASCMALVLAISSHIRRPANWNTWCIVFQSCLIFTMVLGYMLQVTKLFISPETARVLYVVFRILQHLAIGFVSVVIPLLIAFILEKPWKVWLRALFYFAGILYFLVGLVAELGFLVEIRDPVQTGLFVSVLAFCVAILWANLGKIEDIRTRNFLRAVNIVVVALIPSASLIYLYPVYADLGYPSYVIAFSVMLMVFFFIRAHVEREILERGGSTEFEDLSKYRITERESEVVRFICKGMTNKEIAWELKISVNTVNNHVANIFEKIGVRSRIDLIRKVRGSLWV